MFLGKLLYTTLMAQSESRWVGIIMTEWHGITSWIWCVTCPSMCPVSLPCNSIHYSVGLGGHRIDVLRNISDLALLSSGWSGLPEIRLHENWCGCGWSAFNWIRTTRLTHLCPRENYLADFIQFFLNFQLLPVHFRTVRHKQVNINE